MEIMFRHRQSHEQDKHNNNDLHPIHARLFRRMSGFRRHGGYLRHYRYFRYLKPAGIIVNLIILYLLFSWVGIKGIGLFIVALISFKELFQFFFLLRLEKRILAPMEKLRQGLDEVAQGNYDVKVNDSQDTDLELLLNAFNQMTAKLHENEKIKLEYEENRKTLIVNISHDLKTPITAIQGYIEALLEGTPGTAEHRRKYLQTIHNNAIYVNKLIDDLFLFSKLDMQKLDLYYEEVHAGDYMKDLFEEYGFDLTEKKIKFQYQVSLTDNLRLNVDSKRLRQAVSNIINNAVKHALTPDLAIEAAVYRQNSFICIEIKDNGPGIPAEQLSLIFNRFYRADSQRTKNLASTGLGLAIAKELVEAHGGNIAVTSKEAIGTCFTIMLPMLNGEEDEL